MVFLRDRFVDDDETEMARDGEVVRTRMLMMDSADLSRHQRGYRMSDEASNLQDLDAARDAARAARDAWIKQTCDAWRTPSRDAAEPDAAEALLTRHLRDKPDDEGAPDPGDVAAVERRRLTERGAEAQRERDLAWTRYRDNLANAWKTNPRAASAIERQGERWRGGR